MKMRKIILWVLTTLYYSSYGAYTEEFIAPYLGPYIIEKDTGRNCPKAIHLMGDCRLNILTLNNSDNPSFVFLEIEGIDEEVIVKKQGDKILEKTIAKLKGTILSYEKELFSKDGSVFSSYRLVLGKKRFALELKSKAKHNGEEAIREDMNCTYRFDQKTYDKSMKDFCSQYPDAKDCKN